MKIRCAVGQMCSLHNLQEELPVIMGTWKGLRRISDLSSPHGRKAVQFWPKGDPSIQKMWPGHGHSYSSLGSLRMNQLNYHLLLEKCFVR